MKHRAARRVREKRRAGNIVLQQKQEQSQSSDARKIDSAPASAAKQYSLHASFPSLFSPPGVSSLVALTRQTKFRKPPLPMPGRLTLLLLLLQNNIPCAPRQKSTSSAPKSLAVTMAVSPISQVLSRCRTAKLSAHPNSRSP